MIRLLLICRPEALAEVSQKQILAISNRDIAVSCENLNMTKKA